MSPKRLIAATPLALAAATVIAAAAAGAGRPAALVRVDQVGYTSGAPKQALLMTARRLHAAPFTVVDDRGHVVYRGRSGRDRGAWNARFRHTYVLDFTHLRASGRFSVRALGRASPPFAIAPASSLYAPLAAREVTFFQEQRDGPDVVATALPRAPAHLHDAEAAVSTRPKYRGLRLVGPPRPTGVAADVAGGWFDAGDYLKFTETASFDDVMLLLAARDYPDVSSDLMAEARFGTDWLLKMWDERRGVLYYQVGVGDGNGRILGDHDVWRLPQVDDARGDRRGSPRYFLSHRPVFAANRPGHKISPNLAGRTAAAFALCAQVFGAVDPAYAHRCLLAGQRLYALADWHWQGPATTSVPRAYYAEPESADDMELGAIELYIATDAGSAPDLPHQDPYDYMEPAATWADAYMSSRRAGQESLNLYDVSGVAHYDLYRVMEATGNTNDLETDAAQVLRDLHDQLALGAHLAARDPFSLGNPAGRTDTVPHALGYAIEAGLYRRLTGRAAFDAFAQRELDWVLGDNAWGASFIVGAGSAYPRCLAHQVANLEGSLDGRGRVLAGATVDGPTAGGDVGQLGAPDGFRRCPRHGGDRLRALDGRGSRYLDDVRSPVTSEPSDDYAALALLAFTQASEPGRVPQLNLP